MVREEWGGESIMEVSHPGRQKQIALGILSQGSPGAIKRQLVVLPSSEEIPSWDAEDSEEVAETEVVQFLHVVEVESSAEFIDNRIFGFRQACGLERNVVMDVPVSQVYGLYAEGWRPGIPMSVDVGDCCNIV